MRTTTEVRVHGPTWEGSGKMKQGNMGKDMDYATAMNYD